jgi:hypothetical protein
VSLLEATPGKFHGKPLTEEQRDRALEEVGA